MTHKLIFLVIIMMMTQLLPITHQNFVTEPPSISDGFPCEMEGFFAHPGNCRKYFVCEPNDVGDLWATEHSCPIRTVWCQESLQCENPLVCPCQTTTELTTTLETTTEFSDLNRSKSCFDIQYGENSNTFWPLSGTELHEIYPFGPQGPPIMVQCDFETDGGGWTIIQRRSSGPQDEFFRDWSAYENGFGSADANYWIGLRVIHSLTSVSASSYPQELRIELEDWDGIDAYAHYNEFAVAESREFYRLTVGGYEGTAGDSMEGLDGQQFTALDMDNDEFFGNCAELFRGAWWHNFACGWSNLNGYYIFNGSAPGFDGIRWYTFRGHEYSMKKVAMKVRNVMD